ncbi:MAG: hypothetical protein M1828_006966 [Chrysothrix sp. TS-e1954]|nr:MAG: hypothetical protein M1828_006966 [Chrysothrix sp. TS-e1954]
MAPSAVDTTAPELPLTPSKKNSAAHPLSPLSPHEIINASTLLQNTWPEGTDLHFKSLMLQEPSKAQVISLLECEKNDESFTLPERKASISYYIRRTNRFHEAIVNLTTQKVESNTPLGPNIHGMADGEELLAVEKLAMEDEGVKAQLRKLQLPDDAFVVCEPWIYGSDGVNDDERMYQCYLFLRSSSNMSQVDSNHYAHPLSVSPVVSSASMKVIRIDQLPTGSDEKTTEPRPHKPQRDNEYLPESQTLREDLKPLQVIQPEGASFTVAQQGQSSVINWQKWSFRINFNQREGMVLHNVCYDKRSLFYRISLSDMNIPYADPRHPFHKKSAFDIGDAGAGTTANNLKLGCDCLGSIHYLSAVLSTDKGQPMDMPNVVCIHEQDAGISWKHTNYRTNRAVLTRSRELVIQSIMTVANYEYILAFVFNQAAELHYEVRATGIVSTQPIDEGVESVPWGTIVHPGVLAAHHQHIFSLRIDPSLDGHAVPNHLVYSEAHPMPRDPKLNPHGTGYTVKNTTVSHSTSLDTDPNSNRTFKVVNPAVKNPINGLPVGYKLTLPPFQKMLADKDSFHHKRAEFADAALYAVQYREGELFAGGKYTNQSRGGTGVRSWASRRDDLTGEEADLVLFAQFGINHVPRVEDFPVMPCEELRISLKPVNFFDRNPAIDVPPPREQQGSLQSVLVDGNGERASGHCHANGAATNGAATNGAATNGTATNGTATNGTATNGAAANGTATNGATTNGATTNGTTTNGATTNGSAINGTTSNGH